MAEELFTKKELADLTFSEILAMVGPDEGVALLRPQITGGRIEGAEIISSVSGARLRILPEDDLNIGLQLIDDAGTDVFKALVGGTDVGDVSVGNYAGDQGLLYDKSADKFYFKGDVVVGDLGGWTITTGYLYSLASGTPTASPSDGLVLASGNEAMIVYENTQKRVEVGYLSAGVYGIKGYADDGTTVIFELSDTQKIITGGAIGTGSEIAIQGWQHDMVFSATDYRIVAWASGTITLMNGDTYSIDAGNTGNISATTYVYLDIGTSITVLQTTTTAATAVGSGKILIAVAVNNADTSSKAEFQTFGAGPGNKTILVDNIVANVNATNEFISNTAQIKDAIITNAKVVTMEVGKLTAGTILSQAVVIGITAAAGDCYIAGGTYNIAAWTATGGFILGIDDSDSDKEKFFIGDATTSVDWNVTTLNTLTIKGAITITAGSGIANLTDAGALATEDTADFDTLVSGAEKPADNATVGATFGVNVAGGGAGNNQVGNDGLITTITDTAITVTNLAAINADLGTVTAGSITTDVLIVGTDVVTAESRFNTLFDRFVFIGNSNDGLTETPGAGGSITRSLMITYFGIADGVTCKLVSASLGTGLNWDDDFEFVAPVRTATQNKDIFVGLSPDNANVPANATSIVRHIGFFWEDNTLYASNADSSTQTKTEITGLTLTNWNVYRFVWDAGTNIKFYVNDVLKATHTTNLPSGTEDQLPKIWIGAWGVGATAGLWISNNYSLFMTQI